MMPYEYNFEVPQYNYEWDCYNHSKYSPPPPWFQERVYNEPCPICSSHSHFVTECPQAHEFLEFIQKYVNAIQGPQERVYNEPCPICSSHSHFVTECPQAHEFPEFVQKYVNTTRGCLNPNSNNSYSYTHSNEWETHSNSSWTQEPWVEDTNMSYLSSHYIAPPEQPYQHDYPPLSKEIPDFEDRLKAFMQSQQIINSQVAQTSMDIKAQLDELTVMVEALQQEQIREVEIFYKEENDV